MACSTRERSWEFASLAQSSISVCVSSTDWRWFSWISLPKGSALTCPKGGAIRVGAAGFVSAPPLIKRGG